MLAQKLRKRFYLILSRFLSQKNYWNTVGNFSTIDSILDGCTNLKTFFDSGRYAANHFFVEEKLINKNSLTLHIGCGIGRIEKHLSSKVYKCYGVDIAESMIKKAKSYIKAKNTEFIATDGKTLPFSDNYFDFIYSFFVFQHMPTSLFKDNIKEARRALKKGGKFLFQIPLDDESIMKNPGKSNPWLMRYYKFSDIKTILGKNNMKILKTFSGFKNYGGEKFQPDFMVLAVNV